MQRRGRSAVNGCRVFGLGVKMHSKLDLEEEEEREEWKGVSPAVREKRGRRKKLGTKKKRKGGRHSGTKEPGWNPESNIIKMLDNVIRFVKCLH